MTDDFTPEEAAEPLDEDHSDEYVAGIAHDEPADQPITDPDAPEVADALNAALGGSDVEPVVPEHTYAFDVSADPAWTGYDSDGSTDAPPASVAGEKPYIHHG